MYKESMHKESIRNESMPKPTRKQRTRKVETAAVEKDAAQGFHVDQEFDRKLDWEFALESFDLDEYAGERLELSIGGQEAGERVDRALSRLLGVSRSQVQAWIADDRVIVREKPIRANYKVREGDRVQIDVPEPEPLEVQPENIPLDILFEDGEVIVVNKPRGMVVHPAPGHLHGTLVNAILYHCKDLPGIGGVMRPGIVHRIDKDTSGVLMVAKTDRAHQSLSEQLKAHAAQRKYIALVHGQVLHNLGTIDAAIGRHPVHRKQMAVVKQGGRHAVTHFSVLEHFQNYTLLELKLETGRTHQIRVHMQFIGHPLAGDPVYGLKKTLPIEGQALHAQTLGFIHPATGKYMEWSAPLPEDMIRLLEMLRSMDS
ncbi:RluA family pseudouridine synthase [Fodinisporobacter ferrooxydans]|uniref:Pseudouridine synthase n=1 Tax=Fodinisporobacter ferrooxydans TaxID=2901836 RepID=A0ABY4CJ40_9BACL|nr:RluA family pseudouridine synthase [Alicyclobacillaceae bacterium MYW30-H2]